MVLPTGWLLYHTKIRSKQIYVHDVTPITPLPLLFFGGEMEMRMDGDQEVIVMDDFVVFRSPVRATISRKFTANRAALTLRAVTHLQKATAVLVQKLQTALSALLLRKIQRPALALHAAGRDVIAAMVGLITSEGIDPAQAQARLLQGQRVYARR
jgi:hypothetical protein